MSSHDSSAAVSHEARALDLLIQASRTDPVLRDAVAEVEKWVRRLEDDRGSAWQSYDEADSDAEHERAIKQGYRMALRQIMDVPSQQTLLLHAEARAMYEIARRAIEGDVRHVG
jgi:hypothetical protein